MQLSAFYLIFFLISSKELPRRISVAQLNELIKSGRIKLINKSNVNATALTNVQVNRTTIASSTTTHSTLKDITNQQVSNLNHQNSSLLNFNY